MKKYVFDDSTIHTLHKFSKTLYEAFSRADKEVVSNDFDWSFNKDIDFSVNPHLYYNFRLGHYQCFIHQFKNGTYALECRGFVPGDLKPYDVNRYNIELYRNLYGKFLTFDEARLAFADVVSEQVKFHTQPLF